MKPLHEQSCATCHSGLAALDQTAARQALAELPGWELNAQGTEISRRFRFRNFHETMAFVNAIAWIAHREDHHPDLTIQYQECWVRYSTHALGGLSQNDLICAAKISAL